MSANDEAGAVVISGNDGPSCSPRESLISTLDYHLHQLTKIDSQYGTQGGTTSLETLCDRLAKISSAVVQRQRDTLRGSIQIGRSLPENPPESKDVPKAKIDDLPLELLNMIINDEGLTVEDRFCFKVAYPRRFYPAGPPMDRLKQSFSADHKYDLAIRLHRRVSDTYLCSGCKTRHSASLFEDEEKRKDDANRLCIGRTGAATFYEGFFITWSCIEKAWKSSSRLIDSENKTFFSCNDWTWDPKEAPPVKFDSPRVLKTDSGMKNDSQEKNTITVWLDVDSKVKPNDPSSFEATINVELHLPWLAFLLSFCNRMTWNADSGTWFDHISPWNTNLCEHMDLCCEEIFRAVLGAARGWKNHATRKTDERGDQYCMHTVSCPHCNTRAFATFSERKSGGLYLEFGTTRHLGFLTNPTEKKWVQNVSPRNAMRKKLGPKWKPAKAPWDY
ncbi:hypothetical protein MMC10_000600 [Thelotrema lepadinum]|nr:hypothetical protein [Thelotrema lepadinum]